MILLSKSIEQTLNIASGWTVGTLVIDKGVYVQLDNGKLIPLKYTHIIEVKNGYIWQRLSPDDFKTKTIDGYFAYAGMDARIKNNNFRGGMKSE